jgi:hypothetical protein
VERRKRRKGKFPGLRLTAPERKTLREARGDGRRLSQRRDLKDAKALLDDLDARS